MAIVYLEELVEQVSNKNKYLAVNIISKRARALNDEFAGVNLAQKQKPVSAATEELAAGELTYKQGTSEPETSQSAAVFTSESEDFDAVDGDEQFAALYGITDEDESDDADTQEAE